MYLQLRLIRWVLLVVSLVLVGCAARGIDFKKADTERFELGKTTKGTVLEVLGAPRTTTRVNRDGRTLEVLNYAFVSNADFSATPRAVPGKMAAFSLHNDVVVSKLFVSSFQGDATNFDESVVSSIVKDRSTRSDVIKLLGEPAGEAIYPDTKSPDERTISYTYIYVRSRQVLGGEMNRFQKSLVVTLGANDVVRDVTYREIGDK